MQPVKVVLDTNIIISAAISTDGNPAKVFELLLEKKIINHTTSKITKEIEEVMERPLFKKYICEEYKKFILDNFRKNSVIIKPSFNEDIVEDSKDNKFINCALSVKASIVSGDKHLLKLKEYKGIKVMNAKEFLEKYQKNNI